jgi:hypothetical protein
MKIQLTEKWHKTESSFLHEAKWHNIRLICNFGWPPDYSGIRYFGTVRFQQQNGTTLFERRGDYKPTRKCAMINAEKLAIELLFDIIRGTEKLMKQYDIKKDDL